MKKALFLVVVAIFICSTISAQLISSKTITSNKKEKSDSGMILELGLGSLGGSAKGNGKSVDIESDGVSVDFALGYRKVFSPYIAWDVFKLRAFAEINNLGETVTPQLLSSLRGTSPVLFANARVYAGFGIGYGYVIDAEAGGLCYEFQAGMDITSNVYLGLVYSAQKFGKEVYGYDIDYSVSFTGLRLGFKF